MKHDKQIKGQQEILTSVLIMGILITVVGSVYFWGVPLIEKNKDIARLQQAEDFMRTLNTKIKTVANGGGDQLSFTLPGELKFDSEEKRITLTLITTGTIYATNAPILLSRDNDTEGVWGVNDPEILKVTSTELSKTKYSTTYELYYRTLEASTKCYLINLVGETRTTGMGHKISLKHGGIDKSQTCKGNKNLISTSVEIDII